MSMTLKTTKNMCCGLSVVFKITTRCSTIDVRKKSDLSRKNRTTGSSCICICRLVAKSCMWASLRRGVSVCAMRLIFTESWFKRFQGRSVYNVTTEIIPLGNTAWIKRVLGAVIICADGLVFQWVASCRALGTDKFRGWHGHEPMRDVIHHRHSLAISSIFKWRPAQFFHECSRADRWIPPRLVIYDADCASVDLL